MVQRSEIQLDRVSGFDRFVFRSTVFLGAGLSPRGGDVLVYEGVIQPLAGRQFTFL